IISETDDAFIFELAVSGETVQRTIPKSKIHSVTQNDQIRVVNEKPATDEKSESNNRNSAKPVTRTPKQVADLIQQQGSTPPDWLAAAKLEFPKTLDLSFSDSPGDWNNQKNIGQYIWDIINPNQGRWKQGVKFMYHLLDVNKNNPQAIRKVQETLGDFYFKFFQDYPRAAYWWTKAGVAKQPSDRPWHAGLLAECYWKLGSKKMAQDLLEKMPLTLHHIKLYADMGELDKALKIVDQIAQYNARPDFVYIYAGDACRTAGKFDKAVEYYQKVLDIPENPNRTKEQMERNTKRAAANIIGINAFNRLDIKKIPDGIYKGDSVGFAGQLYVEVTVKDKKITNVKVTSHEEKQYYSSLDDIPHQIISKQSLTDIDAVSGATATSEAIVNAAAKALVAEQKK
ncbi:MAG: FMN-binding protein, partial [Thermoguttaceae bacterium]